MFVFRGTHVEQQLLLRRFIHHLPNHTKLSRITSSQPCKHAASITESPSQDKLLLIRFFLQSLLGHSLQNALWLSPTLSQNFRGTFAKIPLSADPSHQQGAHQRKSKHQGPSRLALAKPHFWKLGCCVWSLFLETSESNVRQYQRQVQGGAWRPMKRCHSPAGPPGGRRW